MTGCRRSEQLVARNPAWQINILRIELALGIWIGAVTFTGSVVAYGKLAGNSSKLPLKDRQKPARNSCPAGIS